MTNSIKRKIRESFRDKKKVKIKYYSLSSDEVRWRIVSVYKMRRNYIQGYCHLRNDERVFVIDRIRSVIIQEK